MPDNLPTEVYAAVPTMRMAFRGGPAARLYRTLGHVRSAVTQWMGNYAPSRRPAPPTIYRGTITWEPVDAEN